MSFPKQTIRHLCLAQECKCHNKDHLKGRSKGTTLEDAIYFFKKILPQNQIKMGFFFSQAIFQNQSYKLIHSLAIVYGRLERNAHRILWMEDVRSWRIIQDQGFA